MIAVTYDLFIEETKRYIDLAIDGEQILIVDGKGNEIIMYKNENTRY